MTPSYRDESVPESTAVRQQLVLHEGLTRAFAGLGQVHAGRIGLLGSEAGVQTGRGPLAPFLRALDLHARRVLGFNDAANLDGGDMWPTSFAAKKIAHAVERDTAELIKKSPN